jgi:hypothetical protein
LAEPITYIDIEFHFTHGEPLYVTLMDGRDTFTNVGEYAQCELKHETGEGETTITIHRDKLNGVRATKRVVKPEPRQHGDTILELS